MKSRSGSIMVIIILVFLLVIALVTGGYFFYLNFIRNVEPGSPPPGRSAIQQPVSSDSSGQTADSVSTIAQSLSVESTIDTTIKSADSDLDELNTSLNDISSVDTTQDDNLEL